VNRTLSLLAAFVSIVAIAMQAVSSVFQLGPLAVLESGSSLSALNHEQLDALALIFFRLNADAFYIYLVLFGFWCVLIGYLIFKSTFIPRYRGAGGACLGVLAHVSVATVRSLCVAVQSGPSGPRRVVADGMATRGGCERRTMDREGKRSGGMILDRCRRREMALASSRGRLLWSTAVNPSTKSDQAQLRGIWH